MTVTRPLYCFLLLVARLNVFFTLDVYMIRRKACSPTEYLDSTVMLFLQLLHQTKLAFWPGVVGFRVGGGNAFAEKRLDRGHTPCLPSPAIHLTEMEQRIYMLHHQLLDPAIKYTLIDFHLNQHLWDKARNILDFWTITMSHCLKLNPPQP